MSLSLFCVHSFIFTFGACQPFKARCIKCVSIMSLSFLNSGPRSFQGCIKGVSRVLQDVSPVFQGFFQELQDVSRKLQRSITGVLMIFQGCFESVVLRVSPGCLKDVLRVFKMLFQDCSNGFSMNFKSFFKGVSRMSSINKRICPRS